MKRTQLFVQDVLIRPQERRSNNMKSCSFFKILALFKTIRGKFARKTPERQNWGIWWRPTHAASVLYPWLRVLNLDFPRSNAVRFSHFHKTLIKDSSICPQHNTTWHSTALHNTICWRWPFSKKCEHSNKYPKNERVGGVRTESMLINRVILIILQPTQNNLKFLYCRIYRALLCRPLTKKEYIGRIYRNI